MLQQFNVDTCLHILGILSIISVTCTTSYTTSTMYMKEDLSHQDLIFVGDRLENVAIKSLLGCSNRCLRKDDCMSVFYHKQTHQCVLQSFLGAYLELHQANTNMSSGWKYYEKVEGPRKTKDCTDLREDYNHYKSGVYYISPETSNGIRVYCDMTTDDGGWTVIQRHSGVEGTVDFNRSWPEYETGFGNPYGDLWLGNKLMHVMTSKYNYELRINLTVNLNSEVRYANYETFRIGDNTSMYVLTIGGYSGNAGDNMAYHNEMKFSTKDRDNDLRENESVMSYGHGPWWHKMSTLSSLNQCSGGTPLHWYGINWVRKSVMMIRRL